MSNLTFKGVITHIGTTQVVSDKFKKREVWIQEQSEYPQTVCFEFHQDKTGILDKYAEGQIATISFNLRGREWTNPQGEKKVFNTLQAWRIEAEAGNTVQYATAPEPVQWMGAGTPAAVPAAPIASMKDEDLPF
jgi:single-strand DNA-binding protein